MRSVRARGVILLALLLSTSAISVLKAANVSADQIQTRSLTLLTSTDGSTGGSTPSGVATYLANPNHQFKFTLPTAGTVGSIKFEYCTVAVQEACVAPTGMNAAAATYGSDTGSSVTGFSILAGATANSVIITRTAAAIAANANVVTTLNNVQNPSVANYTFFVRISSYASTNATGTAIDTGSVAASTSNPIILSGIMPESLIFCTGETIDLDPTTFLPLCSTATAGTIEFTTLFSTTATAFATSQMAASTNAGGGYTITVTGSTLMNGTTPIPNIAVAKTPSIGVSEFGMNLVRNQVATTPVGGDITPVSDADEFRAQALTGYDTPDTYKYVSGDSVADSGNTALGPTNSQRYTSTYMVNVAGNQLAGTYSTTLTYICTPTF